MCRPQNPGKVEKDELDLKRNSTKSSLETDGNWADLLPFAPTKGLLHSLL